MNLNKQKFLQTEFGAELIACITSWDIALSNCSKFQWQEEKYKRERKIADWCQAQWEVYKLALRQFYQTEYYFSRTTEYFGICTKDETDWLFQKKRSLL